METLLLVLAVLLAVSIFAYSFRKTPRCPSCKKTWVPGQNTCPFCGAIYGPSVTATAPATPKSISSLQVARLVCIEGPQRGQEFPMSKQRIAIGRGRSNDVQVESLLVSRRHAEVTVQNGQCVLFDQDSTNGTYVNGHPIKRYLLHPGAQIQIGPAVWVFTMPGASTLSERPGLPSVRVITPGRTRDEARTLGNYQLTEKIAVSGMASVYKGVSLRDNVTVAIKILHEDDRYVQKKFKSEAEIGMSLHHPHIARVLDHGSTEGTFFIVMEYVDNGSLRERLKPGQPMALTYVVPIVGQICDALHYAHTHPKKVVHRDIKPENIMFSSREGVKVIDFGIARVASLATRTSDGMILGTPYYMSCEQARGDSADARSDIYSLGVVLYEMLTGRVPFDGEPLNVVHKHLTQKPILPSQINSAIAPNIESVVLRALAKDPSERFATATQMAAALGYAATAPAEFPPVAAGIVGERREVEWQSAMAVSGAYLVVIEGIGFRRQIPLAADVTVLRRRDIDPHDLRISREHARIIREEGQFWLEDMGSANGTLLNGRRLNQRVKLQRSDQISIGNVLLRFESGSEMPEQGHGEARGLGNVLAQEFRRQ